MYTVIPKRELLDHRELRSAPGDPVPQIIDHREQDRKGGKWLDAGKNGHQPFDDIRKQRDEFILSELKFTKRIKDLEKENEDLLKLYEPTKKENDQLRGHLLHGPDAQKIKRLQQEKKELMSELEIIRDENEELTDRIKELEHMFVSERDYYLEKKWRQALERGRKRREEKDAGHHTQGPFANSRKPKKRNMKTVRDEDFEKQDEYDLRIDTLEKETQILMNKIRNIKENKESISYANFVGKGAITRNSTIAKAVNEKLERDMDTFEDHLENLRKKARLLNIDTDEAIAIPEKKLKPKQIGTRYFRTRHTQTDAKVELENNESQSDGTKENKEKESAKTDSAARSSKASSNKENHKRASPTRVSKPEDSDRIEVPVLSAGQKSNKSVNTTSIQALNDDVSAQPIGNVEREHYSSPIADHWDHLATKLNETEKYATKKQFTHRDKRSNFKNDVQSPTRSRSSKRQIKFLQEEEHQVDPIDHLSNQIQTNKTKDIESHSAKSQRSVELTNSKHRVMSSSENSYMPPKYIGKPYKDNDLSVDDISKHEPTQRSTVTSSKTMRKTSNMGEIIRYVPRQNSWEIGRRVKHTGEQIGRYSNGPEPIRGHRQSDQMVKKTNSMNDEKQSNWQSTLNNSRVRKESIVYQKDKLKPRMTQSDEEYIDSRNISAYDQVLADVRKQYKDQTWKKDADSKEETETAQLPDKYTPDAAYLRAHQIDFKSFGRTGNANEQRDMLGSSGLRREINYNLDLL